MDPTWSKLPLALPASLKGERRGELAVLHLARAQKRNAIDLTTLHGIKLFFNNLADDVKAVVICGDGEHFSAGLDLSELADMDAAEGAFYSQEWHKTFNDVQYARVPVISVLRGAVIGAGLELASATHIRVAEPSTYYGLPEGQRGIFLGGGGAMRLTRLMGVPRVTDLMMTGRTLTAQEGYMFGFSQYLVAEGDGLTKGIEVATRAAANAPLSNFAIIHALPRIVEMSPEEGLFTEALMTGITQSAPEAKARLTAFLEKRAAKVARPTE
jgi:enoyl-CoA hydratase/carnithine racemase